MFTLLWLIFKITVGGFLIILSAGFLTLTFAVVVNTVYKIFQRMDK